MTAHHDIFIHPGRPEETLLADMAEISGGRLRLTGQEAVNYNGNLGNTALELALGHDYEADKGVPFDRYQVVVTVRDFAGDKDREERCRSRVRMASAMDDIRFGLHHALRKIRHNFSRAMPRSTGERASDNARLTVGLV